MIIFCAYAIVRVRGLDSVYVENVEKSSLSASLPTIVVERAMQALAADAQTPSLTRRRSWGHAPPMQPSHTPSISDEPDDDQVHLTHDAHDTELHAGMSLHARRRTKRYTPVSPVKMTGSALKSVSKSLHRASLRVVNLSNTALEKQVRLLDDEDNEASGEEDGPLQQQHHENRRNMPLRGRTLGFFGPESRVRLALNNFLLYRCAPCTFFSGLS